ncbi:hypothetical protein GGG16DRAFT_24219, partial [Schizophyllum commune]
KEFSVGPNRRRHARGPSAKGAAGVGYPLLPTPDCQRHARAPSAKDAAGVEAPYHLVIFADPQPPEACARTLGEGCGRGGVPLTPHAALL